MILNKNTLYYENNAILDKIKTRFFTGNIKVKFKYFGHPM